MQTMSIGIEDKCHREDKADLLNSKSRRNPGAVEQRNQSRFPKRKRLKTFRSCE